MGVTFSNTSLISNKDDILSFCVFYSSIASDCSQRKWMLFIEPSETQKNTDDFFFFLKKTSRE